MDVLAGELAVDGREGVELVLEEVLVLVVEVADCQLGSFGLITCVATGGINRT